MKVPSFLGTVVAVCLPGLVALVPPLQQDPRGIAALRAALPGTHAVEIRHREGARFLQASHLPVVEHVRTTVDHALALQRPTAGACQRAREALGQHYGARVTEEAMPPHYIWWWNGEEWVIICLSGSTFAVSFGRNGTVEVTVRDWVVQP